MGHKKDKKGTRMGRPITGTYVKKIMDYAIMDNTMTISKLSAILTNDLSDKGIQKFIGEAINQLTKTNKMIYLARMEKWNEIEELNFK